MKKILVITILLMLTFSLMVADEVYFREKMSIGQEDWAPPHYTIRFIGDYDTLGILSSTNNTDTIIAGTLSISGLQGYEELWWTVFVADVGNSISFSYIVPVVSISDQLDIEAPTDTNTCVVYAFVEDIAGNPVKNAVLTVTSTGNNVIDTWNN